MHSPLHPIAFTFAALAVVLLARPALAGPSDTLWYPRPAAAWVEALPVGNGRLGGMVYGGVGHDRIQVNEDTIWAGGPYDPANPAAFDAYAKARRLIFAGKQKEADDVLKVDGLGSPSRQASYQTLGELVLDVPNSDGAIGYRRSLELSTAVATTTYTVGGTTFTRQVFSSAADQVLVVRLTASRPGSVDLTASFTTPHEPVRITAEGGELTLSGTGGPFAGRPGQVRFESVVRAVNDGGTVSADRGRLTVAHADAVTLLLACRTNFVDYHDLSGDPDARVRADLSAAAAKPFDQLLAGHGRTYRPLYDRVSIDLGTTPEGDRPTDERVKRFADGRDPALAALEYQYGRYLLISCSRPGGQPANLQGMWNESMSPPWNGKYTVNINTEMNYWPAEKANLSECVVPLFDLIRDVSVTGRRTARVMYHADGWVLHHNTDLWRATAPIDYAHIGIWPTGGAWLLTHVWDHYQYTGDRRTIEDFYPAFKGASTFFLQTLVEEPTHHWLVTCPSVSPEHGGEVAGPTMDMSILRDLFDQTARVSEILGVDADFRATVRAARARLAPFQVGRFGQLQEWLEDKDRETDAHRHPSHLYALFPSDQITAQTPALFAAARKSLLGRGDAATGWSLAWKMNLWARALDGNHAYLLLTHLLSDPDNTAPPAAAGSKRPPAERPGGTYPNLFDAHPPFQIDGNFGATSGITEMLLQSHEGFVRLLPALPDAWPEGHVSGIVARGGFVVELRWTDHRLASAALTSRLGLPCRIHSARPVRVAGPDGRPVGVAGPADDIWTFPTTAGARYVVTPLP